MQRKRTRGPAARRLSAYRAGKSAVGASTAMFSVIDTVLLRPLPFPEPDRLVQIDGFFLEAGWTASLSHANFWDLLDLNEAFSDVGAGVSVGFFRALAVTPAAGRLFADGEDEPGQNVVVLSNGAWTSRFGSRLELVGQTLTLDGRPHTVVGVLPPGTPWLDAAEAFVPLVREPDAQRGSFELIAIGRVKPGISVEQASTP